MAFWHFLLGFYLLLLLHAVVVTAGDGDNYLVGHNNTWAAEDLMSEINESLLRVGDFLQKASVLNDTMITSLSTSEQCGQAVNAALISTPWLHALVLNHSYTEAITYLDHFKDILSSCSELNMADSVRNFIQKDRWFLLGFSEAMLDSTHQASKYIENAYGMLEDLRDLRKQAEMFQQSRNTNQNNFNNVVKDIYVKARNKCEPDGSKCQFSRCGAGKMLANCAVGFAGGVSGGAEGEFYSVTSPEDNPRETLPLPGTLRYALTRNVPVWITFAHDMVITLNEPLWIGSNTTVDGRGANVSIRGKGIVISSAHNVILHNFQVGDVAESDTVHIYKGVTKVWIDHLTSFNGKLGLVTVIQGSTDVTISNSLLSNTNFNMLLGGSDMDTVDHKLRVTVYRNWFKDSTQRMPHCRWGYCHVVNNVYSNWGYYAIGGRAHAKIYSESNVFSPGQNRQEVTPWYAGSDSLTTFDTTATIQSRNDLFLNGATFHQFLRFGTLTVPRYVRATYYPPIIPTAKLATLVQDCSGALFGRRLRACLHSARN